MENDEKRPSIFEQEDYDGGLGSGPLTSAPEPDEEDADDNDDAEDDATEARLHATSESDFALMTTLMGAHT